MIDITKPEVLFGSQKLYRFADHVEIKQQKGIRIGQKNEVAVFYDYPKDEKLSEELSLQLEKILLACKLTPQDVLLVNTSFSGKKSIADFRSHFPINRIISFCDLPGTKNIKLKTYQRYEIDGIQIIKSDPLVAVASTSSYKMALWDQLQPMFGIVSKPKK